MYILLQNKPTGNFAFVRPITLFLNQRISPSLSSSVKKLRNIGRQRSAAVPSQPSVHFSKQRRCRGASKKNAGLGPHDALDNRVGETASFELGARRLASLVRPFPRLGTAEEQEDGDVDVSFCAGEMERCRTAFVRRVQRDEAAREKEFRGVDVSP